MGKINVTNHALIRRYERFGPYTTVDKNILEGDILFDFSSAQLVLNKIKDTPIYKSKEAFYVVSEDENEKTIITTYPVEKYEKTDYYKRINDIVIMSKLNLNKIEQDIIQKILYNNDEITVKHMGYKKLMLINNFLILLGIDYENTKTYFKLFKIWNIKDLFNVNEINKIREEYYGSSRLSEWEDFLKKLNLFNYIIQYKKQEDERYPEEVQTYRKVLNGTLQSFPMRFWEDDKGGIKQIAAELCVKYLIEKVLEWTYLDIINNFTTNTFKKYKLSGMTEVLYESISFLALDNAYPGRFRPYLFKRMKNDWYWKIEKEGIKHCKETIEWLFEQMERDGYKINKNNPLTIDWIKTLKRYNVIGMLSITFHYDYKEFFKEVFNIEYSDEDIFRYVSYFESKNREFAGLNM